MFRTLVVCCLFSSLAGNTVLAKDRFVLWQSTFQNKIELTYIQRAAELTVAEFGEFEVVSSLPMEQGNAFKALLAGDLVNVIVTGVSRIREQRHLPIYIPLDRGLLGFRLCLISSEHSGFSQVNTLNDFKASGQYIGLGTHWPDRDIIEHNGLKPVHSPNYNALFAMSRSNRFDCFLRSVDEIQREVKRFGDLAIEPHIAFIYPLAEFAFVSTKTPRLHARLKLGLERVVESGAYQALFDEHYQDLLEKMHFYNRKILVLENRNLSDTALQAINEYGIASFVNSPTSSSP